MRITKYFSTYLSDSKRRIRRKQVLILILTFVSLLVRTYEDNKIILNSLTLTLDLFRQPQSRCLIRQLTQTMTTYLSDSKRRIRRKQVLILIPRACARDIVHMHTPPSLHVLTLRINMHNPQHTLLPAPVRSRHKPLRNMAGKRRSQKPGHPVFSTRSEKGAIHIREPASTV